MESLNIRLRELFNRHLLFSIKDLEDLTGASKSSLHSHISRMKSPKWCGKYLGPVDLVQDIGYHDGIKRWGLRGVREIYQS